MSVKGRQKRINDGKENGTFENSKRDVWANTTMNNEHSHIQAYLNIY